MGGLPAVFLLIRLSFPLHHSIKSAGEIVVATPIALWLSGVAFDLGV